MISGVLASSIRIESTSSTTAVIMTALYHFFFMNNHVVTKIVEILSSLFVP